MKLFLLLVFLVLMGSKLFLKLSNKWDNNASSNVNIAMESPFSKENPTIDNNKLDYVQQVLIDEPVITFHDIIVHLANEIAQIKKNSEEVVVEQYLEPYLNKKFKWTSFDKNLDDVLKAVGVTDIWKRRLVKSSYYAEELVKEAGYNQVAGQSSGYNLIQYTLNNKYDTKFKFGEEAAYSTLDGRSVKAVFSVKHNVLKEEQKWMAEDKERTATVEREYEGDKMKATTKIDGITSISEYVWKK